MSRKRRISAIRKILGWGWIFLFAILFLTIVQVFALRYVNPPFTFMMAWSWVQAKDSTGLTLPQNLWRPLKEVSPHLRRAVLAGEDQRFLFHHGFDFTEMSNALTSIFSKKAYRGASTITMQAARTVFLWPQRSWLRKAAEAYYTVLIEVLWSKGRILEIYLNTVDWGKGLIGAEAASREYFHTSSTRISRSQAALLAAILPNPHRWSPIKPNRQVLIRQKRILKDMQKMPLLT